MAIVGPSGSGKTTTMRLIGGFEAPDSGSVSIAGQDVTALPAEKRSVNTVFQSYALFPHLNVLDNVAFGPRMRGMGRTARLRKAQELLDLVRLPDAGPRKPGELSGGMQQRVALARALANDPAVLLLDEPLGALDRKLRVEMQRELRRVRAALGSTFIYVTHDQEEAFGMADRLAVMRDGRIEQIGDPARIYDKPANAWVALFVGSANSFAARIGGPGARAALAPQIGTLQTDHVCARSARRRAGRRGGAPRGDPHRGCGDRRRPTIRCRRRQSHPGANDRRRRRGPIAEASRGGRRRARVRSHDAARRRPAAGFPPGRRGIRGVRRGRASAVYRPESGALRRPNPDFPKDTRSTKDDRHDEER